MHNNYVAVSLIDSVVIFFSSSVLLVDSGDKWILAAEWCDLVSLEISVLSFSDTKLFLLAIDVDSFCVFEGVSAVGVALSCSFTKVL